MKKKKTVAMVGAFNPAPELPTFAIGDVVEVTYNQYTPPLPITAIEYQCGKPYYRIKDRTSLYVPNELRLHDPNAPRSQAGLMPPEAMPIPEQHTKTMEEALSEKIHEGAKNPSVTS